MKCYFERLGGQSPLCRLRAPSYFDLRCLVPGLLDTHLGFAELEDFRLPSVIFPGLSRDAPLPESVKATAAGSVDTSDFASCKRLLLRGGTAGSGAGTAGRALARNLEAFFRC